MNYTVSDFYRPLSGKIKLLAGAGGLARPISDAGILDYEMVPELKNRYINTNFQPNQLIVTTFLYTRDNPYQITEAIKHLISKGTSCLVIKNIFHIQIHDSALRYADSKNFPIFMIESHDIYIESVIYDVKRYCQGLKDIYFAADRAELILSQNYSDEEIRAAAKSLCPSFCEQYYCIAVRFDDTFGEESFAACEANFNQSSIAGPGRCVILRPDGLLAVISDDNIEAIFEADRVQRAVDYAANGLPYLGAGISQMHLSLTEFRLGMKEAIQAAEMAEAGTVQRYDKLGTFRIVMPYCRTPEMQRFSSDILDRINDYDIENNGHVLETLQAYVLHGASVPDTAAVLSQHVNTVRYRLDRVRELTGLDYKNFSDLEQLSLAVKIGMAAGM